MMRRAEVFRVPEGLVRKAWEDAASWLQEVPKLNLNAQRIRLLKGEDMLWVAVLLEGAREVGPSIGVLITRITEKPPSDLSKPFPRLASRSLTVHLAEGIHLKDWIANAVRKITQYAKDHECRQLFILARKDWRKYAVKFYSRDFEAVGYSRDRKTPGRGSHYPGWNKIGHYRLMKPVKKMTNGCYNTGSLCHFEEPRAL